MAHPSAPTRTNKFEEILRLHDITGEFALNLKRLELFKVILICDDSTSMRQTNKNGQSRWAELRDAVKIVIDITSALSIESDVYFLNKFGVKNVQNFSHIEREFQVLPCGGTPLNASFEMALKQNMHELQERNLLFIIFTDGCPTSQELSQKDAINQFKNTLMKRQPIDKIYVTIVACTDDDHSLKYLNDWDKKIKNLDVVDDYENEKKEIYRHAKRIGAFSYGDYIAKILLGSHVPSIDKYDEAGCCLF